MTLPEPAAPLLRVAPAKVNLSLRILGRRPDGYHRLEGLVAFAATGDLLRLETGGLSAAAAADRLPRLSLDLDGAFAGQLLAAGDRADNLVLRAATLYAQASGERRALHFRLTKNLPVASGIGGGSADAAAALHLMQAVAAEPLAADGLAAIALSLGADVPMCLEPSAQYVSGIGEWRLPLAFAEPLPALLVNPGVAVATAAVFRALAAPPLEGDPAPRLPGLPQPIGPAALIDWLQGEPNDLEAPAIRLAPVIGDVLAVLRASDGCRLARMSGSGATCFALYDDDAAASDAAAALAGRHPDWWLLPTRLG